MKIDRSLTDISCLSFIRTCSCSTCTCSNYEYFETNNDYLTYIFIILYENSIWCIQMIYELFFKSFWQVLMYLKQELQSDNKTISRMDMISINNSTSTDYSLISKYSEELSQYNLSLLKTRNRRKNNNHHNDQTFHSISNEIVISVRSVYCQTEIFNNDLHKPLIFISSTQNQTFLSSNDKTIQTDPMLCYHSEQQSSNEKRDTTIQNNQLRQHKIKQKRRRIIDDDNNIPLTLATSLHSNASLDNIDYFLTKYIHQLFTNKHKF